ncbi:MAG: phosphopyruvate hydratase [Chloroflexi bacterium]|nr:phosphopyruvate hydratase [Chloroflexota bacterium]MBK90530.1 phosphopyruvate hydratase [Chloroflexota bacterium]|tara:strand:- start:11532 stop:12818 length:1287 start_codon:yes stop_codon:yes gene_type:complete
MYKIKSVLGREILDSRGNPTVGVEVTLEDGKVGLSSVPSGASTGSREALELRDNDSSRFMGKGVLKAVENINNKISKALISKDVRNQIEIDNTMIDIDGTEEKKNIGANAILGVSLAILSASSQAEGIEIYQKIASLIQEKNPVLLPVPMLNIMNGGAHAINSTDFQEFMIAPVGFGTFSESIRAGSEIYSTLGKILEKDGLSTNVGFEGGYAPPNLSNNQVLDYIMKAIEKSGYKPGENIFIALDPASSEFGNNSKYNLSKENLELSSEEMIEYYSRLIKEYPIYSIEDGLSEDDWTGWNKFTEKHGKEIQIVGDDLFVTQKKYLEKGINDKSANSILIKFNQVGTISETIETINYAIKNNFSSVISHRSGETEDTTIADLAVGTNAGQIKTGAPARSDRVAKYNRLLRIEEKLKDKATFAGKSILF